MTQDQRTRVAQAIHRFHERATDATDVLDRVGEVLGLASESPLYDAMWALIGGYIEALGAAHSIDGWLEWWWSECQLGKNPLKAGLPGKELRVIKTVDDLVQLVLEDLEQVST